MKVLTKELIKASEENAVHSGAFSFLELMKVAGERASEIIAHNYDVKNKKIAVVCGNGNNGGDGFVVARALSILGADVTVIIPLGEPLTDSAKYYFSRLHTIPVQSTLGEGYDIIIDALFGIGLNRPLDNKICSLITEINFSNAIKISIDIPSGIECDTGKILGACIKAALCITFIALKPCFMLPPATDYCERVVVADINVEPCVHAYETIEKPHFEKRKKNSHKGTYGTALLYCGSYGMLGAAILSAKACLRSGIGIAKCVLPKSIYHAFTCTVPEAVCVPCRQTLKGTIHPNINVKKISEKATAVLIGCGLCNNRQTKKLLKKVIANTKVPLVIDADGINALCENIHILKEQNIPIIITPHPAEMARLTGLSTAQVEDNRIKVAFDFATQYNCYLVLKGANTIIATPKGEIFFNMCGNAGLATGGSGDVLAGITVSLLAQGVPVLEALKAAVYIHSYAADKVKTHKGEHALLPSDIIEIL